ncbi:transmembrane protein 216 isoform X4 [Dermochelys coriacea]|uniref:transmembrane protein 216 isoform X4 n=1 Tax=Dermochelys coriacea TaxID=27794 RepID=UPI0018E8BAD0|nr:transmembrane protein 216 isoform X4 [Dermochelys coriacea]
MEWHEPLRPRTSASPSRVPGSDVAGWRFPWRWKMAPRSRQLSSTPLEILLFLNGWYYATYFLLEIFIFIYKGLLLPYPSANLALDLVMLFLYLGIEVTRIFFGSKGNLCQRKVPLSISLALTFPAAVMAAYYLLLQTYALRLEAILNAILLLFYAIELLLGILTLASFSRVDSY